jgi:hypothetical protein
MKIIKINDTLVDFDKIENPNLKKVLRLRCNEFMFNYGDTGSKHSESPFGHSEYRGGGSGFSNPTPEGHTESAYHRDEIQYSDYSERSGHYDETKRQVYGGHIDETRHRDSYIDQWHEAYDATI